MSSETLQELLIRRSLSSAGAQARIRRFARIWLPVSLESLFVEAVWERDPKQNVQRFKPQLSEAAARLMSFKVYRQIMHRLVDFDADADTNDLSELVRTTHLAVCERRFEESCRNGWSYHKSALAGYLSKMASSQYKEDAAFAYFIQPDSDAEDPSVTSLLTARKLGLHTDRSEHGAGGLPPLDTGLLSDAALKWYDFSGIGFYTLLGASAITTQLSFAFFDPFVQFHDIPNTGYADVTVLGNVDVVTPSPHFEDKGETEPSVGDEADGDEKTKPPPDDVDEVNPEQLDPEPRKRLNPKTPHKPNSKQLPNNLKTTPDVQAEEQKANGEAKPRKPKTVRSGTSELAPPEPKKKTVKQTTLPGTSIVDPTSGKPGPTSEKPPPPDTNLQHRKIDKIKDTLWGDVLSRLGNKKSCSVSLAGKVYTISKEDNAIYGEFEQEDQKQAIKERVRRVLEASFRPRSCHGKQS